MSIFSSSYVCWAQVSLCVSWKLGQLKAGNTVRFKRISYGQATALHREQESFLEKLAESSSTPPLPLDTSLEDTDIDPRLHVVHPEPHTRRPGVVFRQAGDSAILVEFGEMQLDFAVRARIHAFEAEVRRRAIPGIWFLAPCIRSTMVSDNLPKHYVQVG